MTAMEPPPDRRPSPPAGKRPRKPLVLTQDERSQLEIWRDFPNYKPWQRALRARIILACAETTDAKLVASESGVSLWTVYKWRTAFIQRRLKSFTSYI